MFEQSRPDRKPPPGLSRDVAFVTPGPLRPVPGVRSANGAVGPHSPGPTPDNDQPASRPLPTQTSRHRHTASVPLPSQGTKGALDGRGTYQTPGGPKRPSAGFFQLRSPSGKPLADGSGSLNAHAGHARKSTAPGPIHMGGGAGSGAAAVTQLYVRGGKERRGSVSEVPYGASNISSPVRGDDGMPGGGGPRRMDGGPQGPQKAAIPRIVQDTVTCIPLLKLMGRFSHQGAPQPVRDLGRRLRSAVGVVQAPVVAGMTKIKDASKEFWAATSNGMDRVVTFIAPASLVNARRSISDPGVEPSTTRGTTDGGGIPLGGETALDGARALGTPLAPPANGLLAPQPSGQPYMTALTTADSLGAPRRSAHRRVTDDLGAPVLPADGLQAAGGPAVQQGPPRCVYVQVKGARGLVKPQIQGLTLEHASYCVIMVGDVTRRTQVIRGSTTPTWNEVFCFMAPSGVAHLEVWDQDAWGRDCFIGQAELDLTPLLGPLGSPGAGPLDLSMPLLQVDPRTGQVEPGFYGVLSVMAWQGVGIPMGMAGALPRSLTTGQGGVDGDSDDEGIGGSWRYHVSTLMVRQGLPKGLPLVSHGPFGTLYEEPCVMYVKVAVLAFRDLNPERLLHAAVTTNRIIKLMPSASPPQAPASHLPRTRTSPSRWFKWSPSMPIAATEVSSNLTQGSMLRQRVRALRRGNSKTPRPLAGISEADSEGLESGSVSGARARVGKALRGKKGKKPVQGGAGGNQRRQRPASGEGSAGGESTGGQAGSTGYRTGITGIALGVAAMPFRGAMYAGRIASRGLRWAAGGVTAGAQGFVRPAVPVNTWKGAAAGRHNQAQHGQRHGHLHGLGPHRHNSRAAPRDDDLMDDAILEGDMEGVEAGEGEAAAAGEGEDGGEDGDEGEDVDGELELPDQSSSLMDRTSDTGNVVGESTQGDAVAVHDAGPGTYYYIKATMGTQTFKTRMRWMSITDLTEVKLPMTRFVFTMARPLPELTIRIALYITPTNKRKGRVAARLSAPLKSLLDQYAPGSVTNRDGESEGMILPFDDEDFGAAQLQVQVADADWRAALYKVPLLASKVMLPPVGPLAMPPTSSGAAGCWGAAAGLTASGGPALHGESGGGALADRPSGRGMPDSSMADPSAMAALATAAHTGHATGTGAHGHDPWAARTSPTAPQPTWADTRTSQQQAVVDSSMQEFVSADFVVSAVVQASAGVRRLMTNVLGMGCPVQPRAPPACTAAQLLPGERSSTIGPDKAACVRSRLMSVYALAAQAAVRLTNLGAGAAATKPSPRQIGGRRHSDSGVYGALSSGGNNTASGWTGLTTSRMQATIAPTHSAPMLPPAAAAGGPKEAQVRPPIGQARIRLTTLHTRGWRNPSTSAGPVYVVMRCGPHWARSALCEPHPHPSANGLAGAHSAGGAAGGPGGAGGLDTWPSNNQDSAWEVQVPLYDPSTILSIAIVEVQNTTVAALVGKAPEHSVIGKARVRLSTLVSFRKARTWHTIRVFSLTAEADGATGEACASGAQGARGQGGGQGPLAPACDSEELLCVMQVQVQYPALEGSRWVGGLQLLMLYSDAAMPDPYYYMEVDDGDTVALMRKERMSIVQRWLSAGVDPPVPMNVTTVILEDGRASFSLARAQHNFKRARMALRMFSNASAWFKVICTWNRPRKSSEVAFCIFLLCYYPSTAMKLFFFLLALSSWRQYLKRYARNAAGGLCQLLGARGADRQEEEEADVPAQTTLALLRQRYEQILEVALSAQNLFDTIASFLERLQAIMTWQDRVASGCFLVVCLMVMTLIQLLGFSTVLFLVLIWQVRPPFLRDPIPPRPINYFYRLPCQDDDVLG